MPAARVRMPQLAKALIALVPALGACVPIFGNDGPQGETPASASVTISYTNVTPPGGSPGGGIQVDGWLYPGTTPSGKSRTLSRDTLTVVGTAVRPTSTTEFGTTTYRYSVSIPATRAEYAAKPTTVRLPLVKGTTVTASDFEVGFATLRSPDTVVVAAHDSLVRLEIVPPPTGASGESATWVVDFLAPNGTAGAFRLSGNGAPPATLVLPLSYFTFSGEHARAAVQLARFYTSGYTNAPNAMFTSVRVGETFLVTVRRRSP